uniref:Mediator of RNA polymerase II transcription subunit 27 n=1 Tax=Mesocestoides corti TaxID=53468 RepID=A0A0R3UHH8_MESCO
LDKMTMKLRKLLENRSLASLNLAPSLDQLDVQLDNSDSLRRVDWLVGRNEAYRWLRRANYRTEAIQLSLASCGRFLRFTIPVSIVFRNTILVPLSSASDLKNLAAPQMSFALLDSNTRNPILYVKVGEVMHCLITFGNLFMENIIVRGLDESHCVPEYTARSRTTAAVSQGFSQAMSDLLCSAAVNEFATFLLPNFDNVRSHLNSKSTIDYSFGFQNRHLPPSDHRLPTVSQLDLTTPSRHVTFVRVTEAARIALVHFSTTTEPPTQVSALHQFCDWLQTYVRLFTEPCMNCGQLLGQDSALPVLRTFHTNPANARAQHEHCRVIASTV